MPVIEPSIKAKQNSIVPFIVPSIEANFNFIVPLIVPSIWVKSNFIVPVIVPSIKTKPKSIVPLIVPSIWVKRNFIVPLIHSILNVLSMLLWDFPTNTSSEVYKLKWKNHDFQINFFQSFDQTKWKYGFKYHLYSFFNNSLTFISPWFWILKFLIFHGPLQDSIIMKI